MTDYREQLKQIRTFPSLVRFLRDELDWPVETEDFEELTFDYEPEELGIDAANAAKIEEIKRLRPLVANQPWGIFFVKFEPKQLPVVALRRILAGVVVKKRATASAAEQPKWAEDDLLFISNYGEGDERKISFAHFSKDPAKNDLPTLKVIAWDELDTPLHLEHTANLLVERLSWPSSETEWDDETWRERWRSAFELKHKEVITTSKALAERLAELARRIRGEILRVLEIETEDGKVTQLMKAFQESLVHDLDADGFADMYAQTIAYGLLSARIADPEADTADDLTLHMRTNPLLRELMETFLHVGGRRGASGGTGIDFDELGVSEVVQLLDDAKMEAVVLDFGDKNPLEDPVIHFYELFLKEYDATKRMQRGVFYTPRPVVSYIVRSVDELLRSDFGLADGLADLATWGEMVERHAGLTIPESAKTGDPFVTILDPATGTGTFLVEAIEVIHRTVVEKWELQGRSKAEILDLWNDYVPEHLLPRLHGYELLMAPYAIAHLKIGLKLLETGYRFESNERVRIYLTNALEPAHDFSGQFEFAIPALAHEATAVNDVKRRQPFTVVLGNPPYSVSSWNDGPWIVGLVEDFKRTVRAEESQIQSLSNDYIKFLRLGAWHIERAHGGVLGLITGHGYLHGTQPRDLRAHLSRTFSTAYCLDLHGSIRRAGTDDPEDEPVFEIMTGVAILVGQRCLTPGSLGLTSYASLTGRLGTKFKFLSETTAPTAATLLMAETHESRGPYFYFAPSETAEEIGLEYQSFVDLPTVFGTGDRQSDKETYWATGMASQQDGLAVSFERDEVEEKLRTLADSRSIEELRQRHRVCTTDQWDYVEARRFAQGRDWLDYVGQVAYRPFDLRWTVLHRHVFTILRKRVMSHLAGNSTRNVGLIVSRAVNDLAFAHCFVSRAPVDKIFLSSKTSTNAYVFPLFRFEPALGSTDVRPNLSAAFVDLVVDTLGLDELEHESASATLCEEIFHFVYAVLHSPGYRSRYAEFLKIDFPRLPLPGNLVLFRALGRLGGELVATHLMDSPRLDHPMASYVGPIGPEVGRVGWSDDTVWLDTAATKKGQPAQAGTMGFQGVPDAVWNFHIGGYQVGHKWLKDRKGRTLSDKDIAHYQKIVVAISETIRLMNEIDEVIDEHGGWPDAFVMSKPEDAD